MNRFAGLLVAVILVCLLWSAGWFFVQLQVRDAVAAMAAAPGTAQAPRLTCADTSIGGFPFRIDIGCSDATLVADDLTVTAAGVRASVQVDNPAHVVFSARSPLTRADAFYGSSTRLDFDAIQGSVRLTTDNLLAGLQGEGWRIARIALVGDGLAWTDTIGTELPLASASHAELQVGDIGELHDPAAGTATLAIYAVANDVIAPPYDIASGNGEVQLQVSGLPDDIRRFGDPDALASWRQAGGRIDVARVNLTDGDHLLDATGSLTLDQNRMPEGELSYHSRGLQQRLAPFLNPMLLSILAGVPDDAGSFRQALQFANGSILVGGIPLLQLAPLY